MLLVFCVHAAGNAAFVAWGIDFQSASFASLASPAQRILFWLYRSHHGVFLFFVLSGYLIATMWGRRVPPEAALRAASPQGGPSALGRPSGARTIPPEVALLAASPQGGPSPSMSYARFAWRRMLRIYPAFLVAFAASLAFAYASGTWMPPEWTRVLGNLVFLNGAPASSVAPFNIVTWSLFYEMTFYLAFPLLLIALRKRIAVTSLGFLGPVLAVLAGADTLVLCWSLLFAGVALAFARESWPRVPGIIVVTSYLAITTLAALDALPPVAAILAFGVVAAGLVKSCVSDANIVARLFEWAPLRALGRVSYSFYLVHWMIVVLVARAVDHAPAPLATVAIFTGGFALSAVAASVLWWVAERPYFAYVARR